MTHGYMAIVDDDDYDELSKYKWYPYRKSNTVYPMRDGNERPIFMHRQIMGFPKEWIDHKNRNGLDNQKENLRLCTPTENRRNNSGNLVRSSRYKCVRFEREHLSKPWRAYINISGKKVWLGYFETEIEAAKAYDAAAKIYYGEFSNPNFD